MSNENAKVIIPLAFFAWAGGVLASQVESPVLTAAWVIALAIIIPVAVFYLMAEQGWSTLAGLYRSPQRFGGPWQSVPSAGLSLVSVDDPTHARHRLRLVSALRVATTPDALHLSMLFGKVPILGLFFPDVRIPWQDVTSAGRYEAPGWVAPPSNPGALFQASYDPNYKGTFVELTAGQPPVYIQLPEPVLSEHEERLPAS